MSYITNSNAKRIITTSFNCKHSDLKGDIWYEKIYCIGKHEEQKLLALKCLYKNPSKYFNEIYEKIITVDYYKYIYEGNKPCYHTTPDCRFIYSDMINYRIPDDIKLKGKEKIDEFRSWFKSVENLLKENKIDIFQMRLFTRWGTKTSIKSIKTENSGIGYQENIEISELKEEIENNIKKAGRYYYESPMNTTILRKFSRISGIAYKDKIYGNDTGYSDDIVKDFLLDYHKRFKTPLITNLSQYYKLKFNPEIEMEGRFLDQIGFRQCHSCYKKI